VGIPINCKLELVVNQRVPVYPEDKRYRINDNLWKKLSTDQKAGIILHEIILKEVVELGQSYSDNAIYFNAVISSTKMEHQNYDFYANTLTATHLPYRKMIDGQYFKFQGNEKYPLKIYSNGEVQQGIIDQDLWYDSHYLNFTFENTSFPQSLGSPIAFRPDGSLHKGSPLGEQYSLIELDRQGQTLSAVNLDYNNSFWINVKNIDVNTDRKYESWAFNFTPSKNGLNWGEEDKYVIRFYPRYYPQFKIKYGYFTKGHRGNKKRYLHTRENEKVEPAGPIYFDQDGYVIDN